MVLSMKCIRQRNANKTGNMQGGNIAKPKLIEQQLVTSLDSKEDTPLYNMSQMLQIMSRCCFDPVKRKTTPVLQLDKVVLRSSRVEEYRLH